MIRLDIPCENMRMKDCCTTCSGQLRDLRSQSRLNHCHDLCFSFTDTCRRYVKFTTEIKGSALQSHVIKNLTLPANVQDSCRVQCVMESQCLSINVGPHIKGRVLCELSDSDHTSYPYDIKPREGFTYTGTEVTKFISYDNHQIYYYSQITSSIVFKLVSN